MSAGLIIISFFLGILSIVFLISLHELGHFIVAKISKAYVYEYSIGFGPRIFTFYKGKETWFTLRAIPLGGFVSIASEDVEPPKGRENEEVPKERMLEYTVRWKKALFIIAGPLVNLFVAVFLVTTIFMATLQKPNDMQFYGQRMNQDQISYKLIYKSLEEKKKSNLIKKFQDNSQTIAIFGFETRINQNKEKNINENNDSKMTWIDGNNDPLKAHDYTKIVYTFLNEFKSDKYKLKEGESGSIRFAYAPIDIYNGKIIKEEMDNHKMFFTDWSEPENSVKNSNIQWNFNGKQTSIGIFPPIRYFSNTTSAYAYGWKQVGSDSISLIRGLGSVFKGNFNQLAGPIGIAKQTSSSLSSATDFFLSMASLSANLFMLNLLPIPPLDGYKFIENAVEAVIKKEVNKKVKIIITICGVVLFATIFIIVTIKDIIGG